MADRIDKSALDQINPYDSYRVEKAKDSLEEERDRNQQQSDEGEERGDTFEGGDEQEQIERLLKSSPSKEVVRKQIQKTDILRLEYQGVDLKTDPSSLVGRFHLAEDNQVIIAEANISRAQALQLKSSERGQVLDPDGIFADNQIWLKVLQFVSQDIPVDEEEEVTRVSAAPSPAGESTLSQTVRMKPDATLWEKLGVVDQDDASINLEVVLAYLTAGAVLTFLIFGMVYLMS